MVEKNMTDIKERTGVLVTGVFVRGGGGRNHVTA